jgi:hypothetical protein
LRVESLIKLIYGRCAGGTVRYTLLRLALMLVAVAAQAQTRNDLGLSIGAVLPPSTGATTTLALPQSTRVSFNAGLTFEANYARGLMMRKSFALEAEFPLLAVPSESVGSKPAPNVPVNFASLFITPSLRVRLLPQHRLSPWGSIGGGYARYAESTSLQDGAVNTYPRGTNTGALQYGVGADYRLLTLVLPISLRAEVRNLYAGNPSLNFRPGGNGHNDPFITGGFVVHF